MTTATERAAIAVALVSAFLLTAHVASELAAPHDVRVRLPYYFLPGGVATAVVAFALFLPPPPGAASLVTLLYGFGIEYPVGWGVAAWIAGVFDVFAVAFACAPLLLYPLAVAKRCDLVRYDPTTAPFVLSRAACYGGLRAVGVLLVRETSSAIPPAFARLLPLAAASIETLGMSYAGSSGSYTFESSSPMFAMYALLKSAVFVALPVLEDALAQPPAWAAPAHPC